MRKFLYIVLINCAVIPFQTICYAQNKDISTIQTAFPFLLIANDARSGAMADIGVATSADNFSSSYNVAKLAFVEEPTGVAVAYSPWLRNAISGMSLAQFSAYHQLGNSYTLGVSLKYLSTGNVELIAADEIMLGNFKPGELAVDVSLAKKFGNNFSLGSSLRYIRANSLNDQQFLDAKTAQAIAMDVSAYLKNKTSLFNKETLLSYGLSLSNIGTKVSYSENGPKYFLPTNLKAGINSGTDLDEKNKLNIGFEVSKLLVPSSINDTDLSVPSAIFKSFTDAKGGVSEEFKEIVYAVGAEYIYDSQLAFRTGYLYENPSKGNRRYLSLGLGYVYRSFSIDMAYIPTDQQKTPLANTLRFSLAYNIIKGK